MKQSYLSLLFLACGFFALESKILAQTPTSSPTPTATPLPNYIGTHANFKTTDGDEFSDVTIKRITPDGIVVSYPDGVRKLPFKKLPQADQIKYGYNPAEEETFSEKETALAIQRQKDAVAYQTSRIDDLKARQDELAKEAANEAQARAEAIARRPKYLRGGMVAQVTQEGVTIMDTGGHSTFIRYTSLNVDERRAFGFPAPSLHDF